MTTGLDDHRFGFVIYKTRQIWGIWKLLPAYSPETPNLGWNRWCFVPCDLEIWLWPWKTIGHLSFAVSSFVQHFIAIGEFKLELQSGNTQFGSSNSTIFRVVWPWNFDIWPWKTIGNLYYATSSSMHHFVAIGEFKLELQSGNAQFGPKSMIFLAVWPCNLIMTLKNNRAPLLCYFKLYASFRSHWWIQAGVTVRKRPI